MFQKLHFFKNLKLKARKSRSVCLFHGKSVTIFDSKGEIKTCSAEKRDDLLRSTNRPLILLGAPFAFTHVQPTIHLKKADLFSADAHCLGFSRFPNEERILESFSLNANQAITCFTHLSEEGTELTRHLRRMRRTRWKPLVSYFIKQVISQQWQISGNMNMVNLAFDEEILQVRIKDGSPHFRHVFYWMKDEPLNTSISHAYALLNNETNPSGIQTICFSDILEFDEKQNQFLHQIMFEKTKGKIKSTHKQIHKRRINYIKKIPPRAIMVAITSVFLMWSIYLNKNLWDLKEKRTIVQNTIDNLRQNNKTLDSITRKQRYLIRIESLKKVLDQSRLTPASILEKIDAVLPESYWIHSMSLDSNTIYLELLDSANIPVASLISPFEKSFGETLLLSSLEEQLEGKVVRKQFIKINRDDSDINR